MTYPSEKYEFVNWDVDIPNIWKSKSHVPNHQLENDWKWRFIVDFPTEHGDFP